ncbi:MAG: site-2 protease family protein [Deltaproteobacteria bacterium]|nr:site-2 protease family protein [Deltaproteobacteria bacterium]
MMSNRLLFFLLYFPTFLISLSVHESAHAWVAFLFGDDTAKNLGRISLNPIRHMDFVGTFLLPIFFFFTPGLRFPIGGWGKPVPVNPYQLKDPRKDGLWISLAGPASNLLLAIFCAALMRIFFVQNFPYVFAVLEIGIWLNLGLAFFNLVPLHPLDGGKIIEGLLPEAWVPAYAQVARYGFLIIFAVYYIWGFGFITKPVSFLAERLIPN